MEQTPAPKLTLYFPDDFAVKSLAGQSQELSMAGKPPEHYWVLGRKESCEIQIQHERVSSQHCAINYSSLLKRWKLVDLQSSNGTWFKGKRMVPHDPAPIEPGDRFYLANQTLIIAVVENKDDTFQQEEDSATVVDAPAASSSKTFADVAYAAINWVFKADSRIEFILRMAAVSLSTAGLIILIEAIAD